VDTVARTGSPELITAKAGKSNTNIDTADPMKTGFRPTRSDSAPNAGIAAQDTAIVAVVDQKAALEEKPAERWR